MIETLPPISSEVLTRCGLSQPRTRVVAGLAEPASVIDCRCCNPASQSFGLLQAQAEDRFEVRCQDERGFFASVAEDFTTRVAFDSDQLRSLAAGDMTGRVLHSLNDLNGDGVADLVIFSLKGTSLLVRC